MFADMVSPSKDGATNTTFGLEMFRMIFWMPLHAACFRVALNTRWLQETPKKLTKL